MSTSRKRGRGIQKKIFDGDRSSPLKTGRSRIVSRDPALKRSQKFPTRTHAISRQAPRHSPNAAAHVNKHREHTTLHQQTSQRHLRDPHRSHVTTQHGPAAAHTERNRGARETGTVHHINTARYTHSHPPPTKHILTTPPEIDHNFSRAHRIVTGSILPVVTEYGKHSSAVWEGSKFWKQFFEASANISLTGYEDPEEEGAGAGAAERGGEEYDSEYEGDTTGTTEYTGSVADEGTGTGMGERAAGQGARWNEANSLSTTDDGADERPTSRLQDELEGSSLLDSPSVNVTGAGRVGKTGAAATGQQQQQGKGKGRKEEAPNTATPKAAGRAAAAPGKRQPQPNDDTDSNSSFADYPSPYEALKRSMDRTTSGTGTTGSSRATSSGPSQPQRQAQTQKHPATPRTGSSHPAPTTTTTPRPSPFKTASKNPADPLLHRVLDKSYRVQATPHTARRGAANPHKQQPQPQPSLKKSTQPCKPQPDLDSSPLSPDIPAPPQLRPDIFGSPKPAKPSTRRPGAAAATPRTPGISVQRSQPANSARKTLFPTTTNTDKPTTAKKDEDEIQIYASDSDDSTSDVFGRSPPRTMQFHVPVPDSRVVRTPAGVASRRIVQGMVGEARVGGGSGFPGIEEGDGDGNTTEEMEMSRGFVVPTFEGDGGDGDDSPSVVRGRRPEEFGEGF